MVAYLERIELYFQANDIATAKQVPVFLSVIGASTYSLLRNLLALAKLSEVPLDSLKAALKGHYEPKKAVVAERFRFHRRSQAPGESIADYVAELRRLTTHCAFRAEFLEEALGDRLVCGLRSEAIQRRLLTESDLTFKNAMKIAQGMEAAERNAQQLKGADPAVQLVTSRTSDAEATCASTSRATPKPPRHGTDEGISPQLRVVAQPGQRHRASNKAVFSVPESKKCSSGGSHTSMGLAFPAHPCGLCGTI